MRSTKFKNALIGLAIVFAPAFSFAVCKTINFQGKTVAYKNDSGGYTITIKEGRVGKVGVRSLAVPAVQDPLKMAPTHELAFTSNKGTAIAVAKGWFHSRAARFDFYDCKDQKLGSLFIDLIPMGKGFMATSSTFIQDRPRRLYLDAPSEVVASSPYIMAMNRDSSLTLYAQKTTSTSSALVDNRIKLLLPSISSFLAEKL